MKTSIQSQASHQPWNKGKLVGQKAPLRVRDIWAIRVRLQLRNATRDLALFNLAIDSKLRISRDSSLFPYSTVATHPGLSIRKPITQIRGSTLCRRFFHVLSLANCALRRRSARGNTRFACIKIVFSDRPYSTERGNSRTRSDCAIAGSGGEAIEDPRVGE